MKTRLAALTLVAGLASACLAQTGNYTVTDLGRLPGYAYSTVPLGINNNGEVVGLCQGGAYYKAFRWTAQGGLQALPPVPGHEADSSTATAINDNGDIVGFSGQDDGVGLDAWIYSNGTYTMLGTLPGMRGARPLGINNLREVVGHATPISLAFAKDTFYWSSATGMVDLTPETQEGEVFDINDAGIVSGGFRSDPPKGITTWNMRTGVRDDLGSLPGASYSLGYAINQSGQVTGVAAFTTSGGNGTALPILVQPGAPALELGIDRAAGIAINDLGEVVGSATAFNDSGYLGWIWRPGMTSPALLWDQIGLPTSWTRVSDVRGINNAGQIIASSTNTAIANPSDQSRRGILLTPIHQCRPDLTAGAVPGQPGYGQPNGTLNNDDFFYYLAQFASGNPAVADMTASAIPGTPGYGQPNGVINNDDFFFYLSLFAAGC